MIDHKLTRVVVDIGLGIYAANSFEILSRYSNAFILGVDANPFCLDLNQSLLGRSFQTTRFLLLNMAITDAPSGTEIPFFVTANDPGCSSIFQPSPSFQQRANRPIEKIISVTTSTLDEVLSQRILDRYAVIDFVKIDAQGSDLAVLRSGRRQLQSRVAVVCVEADGPDYIGSDATSENIHTEMAALGFEATRHHDTIDLTFVNSRFRGYARDAIVFQR